MTTAMNMTLQKIRLHYLAPLMRQLGVFWSWWTGELVSMLPQNLQTAMLQRAQRICIAVEGSELLVSSGGIGQNSEPGRIPQGGSDNAGIDLPDTVGETLLLLPADKVLVKSLTLPLAAEENLREVLSFEMDRQTPFTADQVYYDNVVVSRDTGSQTLSVDMVLSPRTFVDELLARLSENGLCPDTVSAYARDSEKLLSVNLLPATRRKRKYNTTRRRNLLLTAVNLLLVAVAISTPLVQKLQVIRALEPQVEQAVAQAKEGNELRQQVERLVAASSYLTSKKQTELTVMQVLNEITALLPDDTWINRVEIGLEEIQLQGQSTSSAALISVLEASPLLQEVRFRSPVMRIPSTGEERFHLSAALRKEPAQ